MQVDTLKLRVQELSGRAEAAEAEKSALEHAMTELADSHFIKTTNDEAEADRIREEISQAKLKIPASPPCHATLACARACMHTCINACPRASLHARLPRPHGMRTPGMHGTDNRQ